MGASSGRTKPMRLLLLGKPGSGKGTQAKRIAADENIPAISTGDLIRAAIAEGTKLGHEFKSYTDKGHLVPDELVLAMVEERLGDDDCAGGFLLDGFPRTVPQAETLEEWLGEHDAPIFAAVDIAVPDEALIERAGGRRFCPRDGHSYHIRFAPPQNEGACDQCGGALEQRADDREEIVRARIKEHEKKTQPLVGFYDARGLLRQVDGVGTPEEVEARIEAALHLSANGD